MERIKKLNTYQKIVFILSIAMVIVFFPFYSLIISREGYQYKDAILIPQEENGTTIYSGKIERKPAVFTVTKDKTVTFQYGDTSYGPYTAKEDPTAIPEDTELGDSLTGIELYEGNRILFRGGVTKGSNNWWIYDEDGNFKTSYFFSASFENETDSIEPSISNILDLMSGPSLTHKGDWAGWFYGLILCLFTVVSILFADEIFRWNLAFQIRNVERAEPSDWEIFGRYAGWTLFPILALIVFIVGLQ